MPKLNPYIVTVKFIYFSDSEPSHEIERLLSDNDISALELSIEEAVISPRSRIESTEPAPAPEVVNVEPVAKPAPSRRRLRNEYPFDVKHLELNGPTVAILDVLYHHGPKTLKEIREIGKVKDKNMVVTACRLASKGRIRVVGQKGRNRLYGFVQ